MMNKTKIEWCDSTWNPITGCLNGCEYCYARKQARRFSGDVRLNKRSDQIKATMHFDKKKDAEAYMTYLLPQPFKGWNGSTVPFPAGFEPTFHIYRLPMPSQTKKPTNIFVCSMADLFGNWVPDGWIEKVFAACEEAPQHRYLFLTKNPQRYEELALAGKLPQRENMWYGSTLDSMSAKRYSGRLSDNTFVSIEPLTEYMNVGLGSFGNDRWVIIGAETGNRKGKVTPKKEWVDKICEAADSTHMAVYMKDSLVPIMGEENMRREFPWEKI